MTKCFLAKSAASTRTRLIEHPLTYQVVAGGGGSRRALLRRFPAAVVYEPLADATIVVPACVHP